LPENGAPSAALKQAALNGDPAALYELAVRTMEGRGVPRDPRAAVAMFEKAGEKNLAPAQYRAGNAYEKGLGVTRDVEAARRWYQRAAENGNTRAMHNLAVLMAEGAAGKPDYAAAMTWFVKAAEHGVRDSQFNLAVLYARGLGGQQDLVRSYTWFAIAAGQGDEEAGRKRDEVAARLQPADLARAKSNVERWRVTPPVPTANDAPPPAARMSSHMSGKRQGRA
jgi:localization factor PodJL